MITPLPEVLAQFVMAGWNPTRKVEVPSFIPHDHPPCRSSVIWRSHCGKMRSGIECATMTLFFRAKPMDEGDDEIAVWQSLLDTTLLVLPTFSMDMVTCS